MTYTDQQIDKAARILRDKWYPLDMEFDTGIEYCRDRVRSYIYERADIEDALKQAGESNED